MVITRLKEDAMQIIVRLLSNLT